MTAPLLLTGANGRTGRAVLASLAASEIPVRALVRDPSQRSALLELGATEVALGNLDDPSSLAAAAEGTQRVLHIGPPMHPDELKHVSAMVDAAKAAGVVNFIYYSVMHPLARAIRHHRLKLDAEELLIDSGLPYTIVQPSRYMQHLEPIWNRVASEGLHAMPFSTEQKFSVADLADLAEACAVVASSDRYLYGTYELAGPEALSQRDMAAILADVLGRDVRAEKVEIADMQEKARSAGASEDRIQQMTIMNTHYDAHGFRSNPAVLEMLLGRPATTYRAYVERLARKNPIAYGGQ